MQDIQPPQLAPSVGGDKLVAEPQDGAEGVPKRSSSEEPSLLSAGKHVSEKVRMFTLVIWGKLPSLLLSTSLYVRSFTECNR